MRADPELRVVRRGRAEVLVDNQKCAVLAHPRTGATFNPRFVDVAERYGFVPRGCRRRWCTNRN